MILAIFKKIQSILKYNEKFRRKVYPICLCVPSTLSFLLSCLPDDTEA